MASRTVPGLLAGLLDVEALRGRIEESFVRRLELLTDEARRLLLVAAAEPVGDPLLLWRAAERLGIGQAAAQSAEWEGLLEIGEWVTFRHPLVRSAMYRSAAVQDRRAVHLALADATDRESGPDRRAWHLAAAATGPDEQVALELERSAGRAQARGGLAAAAAFLRRAVTLTKDPGRRADRALAAAEASLQAGAFDAALALLATAEVGPLNDSQSARVDLLRAHVAFAAGHWREAPVLLLQAARRLETFDLDLARETYLTAWGAAGLAGDDLATQDVLFEICHAARALPSTEGAQRPLDLLLDGLALLITDGTAAAMPTLRRAVSAVAEMSVEGVLRWGWVAVGASAAVWNDVSMNEIVVRQVQIVRDAGALATLPIHLTYMGHVTAWLGDLAGAASFVAEGDSVAAATGSRFPPYTLLRLCALQGREAEASAAITSAIESFGGEGMTATRSRRAAAVLCNGQLRTAHGMLVAIGMKAFAERARRELAALGEKVRKRSISTRADLTAQERQIARLARDGLSNPEIGARLFLSPRTVEWHLRNVYTKLDIRTRRGLVNALATFEA